MSKRAWSGWERKKRRGKKRMQLTQTDLGEGIDHIIHVFEESIVKLSSCNKKGL